VRVTDLRTREDLAPSVSALEGLPIEYRLGEHAEEDFQRADLVVANPAVPPSSKFLKAARIAGVPVTTEICLFVAACPARIAGVTGTSGKTTTTHLLFRMLRTIDGRTRLGGNVGGSLLEEVGQIPADAWVVLELSSFQLSYLGAMGFRPAIGVVTNLAPNHLDWHGTLADYEASKRQMVAHQASEDFAVLNQDDAVVRGWGRKEGGPLGPQVLGFSIREEVDRGVFLCGDSLVSTLGGARTGICPAAALRLPGRHNLANAAAAVCAALTAGVSSRAAAEVLATFDGVPHRLERVAATRGVSWVNDSIATSPDRTLVALEAIGGEIVLIAGGYDKGLSYEPLGPAMARRVRELIVIGATAEAVAAALPVGAPTRVHRAGSLEEAVGVARAVAREGDTVLLSPASASYGMFRNFEERGARFRALAREGAA
jgi:UDP-N-acetylmuramoylalanine--D-glutamate ligase